MLESLHILSVLSMQAGLDVLSMQAGLDVYQLHNFNGMSVCLHGTHRFTYKSYLKLYA